MLTFFRWIRMTLWEDGRVSKYLLYALGEIILVVVGIIALQVNNWNQERINELRESDLMRILHKELENTRAYLKSRTELLRERIENNGRVILNYTKSDGEMLKLTAFPII